MKKRKKMSKVIRVGIWFDYYPDEDELIQESNMSQEELEEYYKSSYIDDIYSMVKYNELYEAVEVQIMSDPNDRMYV
jgi:hypothetical protein